MWPAVLGEGVFGFRRVAPLLAERGGGAYGRACDQDYVGLRVSVAVGLVVGWVQRPWLDTDFRPQGQEQGRGGG